MLLDLSIGSSTLDVFPKALHGEIPWAGFALGFDHFHVCGHTAINCPTGKKKLEPDFAVNIISL